VRFFSVVRVPVSYALSLTKSGGAGVSRDVGTEGSCDVLLIIGTSASVHPAATLPELAFERGAILCEVNVEATSLTHTGKVRRFLQGSAGAVLTRLVGLLEADRAAR
jgi:NAD-dependent SIR2 family protein deacetylase